MDFGKYKRVFDHSIHLTLIVKLLVTCKSSLPVYELCVNGGPNLYDEFGGFGLSTKEPCTIMLCPFCFVVIVVIVTCIQLPSHRIRHRNFTFGIIVHICPWQIAHQTFSDSSVVILVFFFYLLSCPYK